MALHLMSVLDGMLSIKYEEQGWNNAVYNTGWAVQWTFFDVKINQTSYAGLYANWRRAKWRRDERPIKKNLEP